MIFRRSIVNELANGAGGVFTVLFSIVLTVGLVRILGEVTAGKGDVGAIIELVIYTSITNLPALLTLSVFIAVLMTLMRGWRDNEIVVWFSSGGLNLFAWIEPVMRFALPLIFIIGMVSVFIGPWARGQIERTTQQFEQRQDLSRISPGRFVEIRGGKMVFFIEQVDEKTTEVKNVFMSEKRGSREIIVHADAGKLRTNEFGDQYVVLYNGRRYESSGKEDAAWNVIDFQSYEVLIEVKAKQAYENKRSDAMPFAQLFEERSPVNDSQVLWRLSWPLAAFNLALLAIPLSYTNPRAGRNLSLLAAVMVFILYLNGISVMQTWVRTEKISWPAGLLLINGSVLALAALLFARRVWMQRWLPESLASLPWRVFGGFRK
ncbi:MAG: LPS export ABC transporter permease LptF [Duodenibacillus sp.]|nr:LPS export ABC transporter permease LptF [Duodenibacillus sp.]